MHYEIEVENIKCSGCVNSIKSGLQELNGVAEVEIELAQGLVKVNSSATIESVLLKLTNLGYPPKGSNTFGSKAKSFLSCAVGNLKS